MAQTNRTYSSFPAQRRIRWNTRPDTRVIPLSAEEEEYLDVTRRGIEGNPTLASEPPISAVKAIKGAAAAAASTSPDIHHKKSKRASVPTPYGQRSSRQRKHREKSGIPELDGDTNYGDDVRTTHNEGEDDWDIMEADGEDRNVRSEGLALNVRTSLLRACRMRRQGKDGG